MPRDASVSLDWADGTYHFRIAWGELELLQEACECGPYVVLSRLYDNTWNVGDISHVIRLGLVGGGMAPVEALKKVRAYVEARPPMESIETAKAVLLAALMGVPEEKLKKKRKAARASTKTQTESSASENSTATALS